MATALGSQTQIGYITEVTAGTTPATPSIYYIPVKANTLNYVRGDIKDNLIVSHRQAVDTQQGNISINGEIDTDVFALGATPTGHQGFDPFYESVFGAAWTSNVLKFPTSGITPKTFTIEKKITTDGGTSQYFRTKGMTCHSFSISSSAASNDPIGIKFSFSGLDQDALATTAITGLVTTNATFPSTPTLITNVNTGNWVKLNTVAATNVTAWTLDVKNTANYNYVVNNPAANSITYGDVEVSGSMTFLFQSVTEYNYFIGNSYHVLEIKLADTVPKSYTFLMSKVKFTAATQTIPNAGTLLVTLPFRAHYNTTDNSSLVITRA